MTSKATDQVRTTKSDSSGQYAVGLLPPEIYTISIMAPGFKTEQPAPVTVVVTETARVDAKMSLGSNTETVEVTSQAAALQVENATLGTVVDGTTIREVPLTNRNYTQVLTMSAGVAGDINNAASLGKGTQDVYVNGASSISNNFHMDGADINNYGSGRAGDFVQQAGIAIPNPDSLQEFKIQTTNYDAGFGRDAGANVDVVTKTGGNSYSRIGVGVLPQRRSKCERHFSQDRRTEARGDEAEPVRGNAWWPDYQRQAFHFRNVSGNASGQRS